MAVITIHEVKRQKPTFTETPLTIKQLEKMMPKITAEMQKGHSAFYVLDHLSDFDDIKEKVRGVKDNAKALETLYNIILHAEGDGVLKEYNKKYCRYKGSAIAGMECHSR